MGILCSAPAGHPQLWTKGIGAMQSHAKTTPSYESLGINAVAHFSAEISSRSKVGAVLHMARLSWPNQRSSSPWCRNSKTPRASLALSAGRYSTANGDLNSLAPLCHRDLAEVLLPPSLIFRWAVTFHQYRAFSASQPGMRQLARYFLGHEAHAGDTPRRAPESLIPEPATSTCELQAPNKLQEHPCAGAGLHGRWGALL